MAAMADALYIGIHDQELLRAARIGAEMAGWRVGFAGPEALYLAEGVPTWGAVIVPLENGACAVFREWCGGLQLIALNDEGLPSSHAARFAEILQSITDGTCDSTHFRNPEVDLLLAEFLAVEDLGPAEANVALFLRANGSNALFIASTTASIATHEWVIPRSGDAAVTGYVLDGNEYQGPHEPRSKAGTTDLQEPNRVLAVPVGPVGTPPVGILRVAHSASLAEVGPRASDLARRIVDVLRSGSPRPVVAHRTAILGPDGAPARPEDTHRILQVADSVNADLLERVARQPSLASDLTPRAFEELVAEMYRRRGFSVELTPLFKDGGVDIWASRHDAFGELLYLVECKRWAPARPVGVEVVRGLYGVVAAHDASAGVVVTTSGFTRGAVEFRRDRPYRLQLTSLSDLISWFGDEPPAGL